VVVEAGLAESVVETVFPLAGVAGKYDVLVE
jgi:hypothetical protein